MRFYVVLIGLNVACFLPFYLMNFREHPNPFEFLIKNIRSPWRLFKTLYSKFPFSDPFRVNFDYTVVVLIAAAVQSTSVWVTLFAALMWTIGLVDFTYSSVMQLVFRRKPSLRSDLRLARSGLSIAHHRRWLILIGTGSLIVTLVTASYLATDYLLQQSAGYPYFAWALAFSLLLLAFYNCHKMKFPQFLFRTVYSPGLNLYKNYVYSNTYKSLESLGRAHFESLNEFGGVKLTDGPDFITVCVESYGSFAFEDEATYVAMQDVIDDYTRDFRAAGLHVASVYSEPPFFTGGSWLSYVSLTYGVRIDDYLMHDALFFGDDGFSSYESLFHVLKRSGYSSFLLCPLGGYETAAAVNWDTINQCFQSDRNYEFKSLDYNGRTYQFLAQRYAYFPPDQYSLNFAYEDIVSSGGGPFSLFFCTLNSHYPWDTPFDSLDDWQALGGSGSNPASTDDGKSELIEKYRAAIRYQLDYLFRFALEHASDKLVITLFGDHQAPFVTPESFGKKTPIHVISGSRQLTRELCETGFVEGIDLTGFQGKTIKHEGFLSRFMKALNRVFGENPDLQLEVRDSGADLLDLTRTEQDAEQRD